MKGILIVLCTSIIAVVLNAPVNAAGCNGKGLRLVNSSQVSDAAYVLAKFDPGAGKLSEVVQQATPVPLHQANLVTCTCEEQDDGSLKSCEIQGYYIPHQVVVTLYSDGYCVFVDENLPLSRLECVDGSENPNNPSCI